MSKVCDLTGAKVVTGNNVSHSKRHTRTTWQPNLQKKRYFIPELNNSMQFVLSTAAIKTIDKQGGISRAIMAARQEVLSPKMTSLKFKIQRMARRKVAKVKVKAAPATEEAAPKAAKAPKAPKANKATKSKTAKTKSK